MSSLPSLEDLIDRPLAEEVIKRSVEVFPAEGILFRQGDPPDDLYFVNDGEVLLTMRVGEKEMRIRAGKNSLLGVPSVVSKQPYTRTAKASWDAKIFKLTLNSFNELLATTPRFQEAVLQILAAELRAARKALADLVSGC